MKEMPKREPGVCGRGHFIALVGRYGGGNRRACSRERSTASKHPRRDYSARGARTLGWASLIKGDFYRVEEEWGLLDTPHPYDPNRLSAWPLGGYGWPTEEPFTMLALRVGSDPVELPAPSDTPDLRIAAARDRFNAEVARAARVRHPESARPVYGLAL